ncbi:CHAT domain-containing protein [Bacteroides sp. 51]|uniref:CHAT domain-containing protein n=1 Tax=Bacteroides sp. 51 TaxID=2302938 RepID=UPI0019402A16|nr:CHAT domain-containing protein [Bacteroides sp. 51]
MNDSIGYFETSFKLGLKNNIDLFAFPEQYMKLFGENAKDELIAYSRMFTKSEIKVFIIDPSLSDHSFYADLISQFDISYVHVVGNNPSVTTIYDANILFEDASDLIRLLQRDQDKIYSYLKNIDLEYDFSNLSINSEKLLFDQNPYHYSNITENNFFILNQIIGNNWLEPVNPDQNDERIYPKPDKRVDDIIAQVDTLDRFVTFFYEHNPQLLEGMASNPHYPTLVLVSPYVSILHSNIIKGKVKTKKERAASKLLLCEQNKSYSYTVDDEVGEILSRKEIAHLLLEVNTKLLYLDYISWLHARYNYSPVVRLPRISKSINAEVAFLNNSFPQNKSKNITIEKFGEKISSLILDDQIKGLIKERNGQIFIISDLPLEWMYIDGVPLCFTHDVCRVPEFNNNAIVNSVIAHKRQSFVITDDIIERTLVIHCASDSDKTMQEAFKAIDSFKKDYGFQSVNCKDINEIKDALEQYQPRLLIFDCHGTYDSKTEQCYLIIDDENGITLSGDDIVTNGISAPLIFISACSTMPPNGLTNLLTDAFMQAGALSVTATLLPLNIHDASVSIVRLLSKLRLKENSLFHCNWLQFISHVLRTGLFHEALRYEREHGNEIAIRMTHGDVAQLLSKTMIFHHRRNSIEELKKIISGRKDSPTFNVLKNDWMSYTIIGRADLIYFDNWLKQHNKYG